MWHIRYPTQCKYRIRTGIADLASNPGVLVVSGPGPNIQNQIFKIPLKYNNSFNIYSPKV